MPSCFIRGVSIVGIDEQPVLNYEPQLRLYLTVVLELTS